MTTSEPKRQSVGRVARLRLEAIRMDFQPPENLIEETVLAYVNCLNGGNTLAWLRVRFDGHNYFLEDGFHRVEAARRCGLKSLKAEILPGSLAEMEVEFRDYLKRLRESLKTDGGVR